MNVDQTDHAGMTREQQVRQLEVEGYAVFPGILDAEQIARIKSDMADAEMEAKSYSEYQTTSVEQPQWHSPAVAELIGYPPMMDFLKHLMGEDILFTRGLFCLLYTSDAADE